MVKDGIRLTIPNPHRGDIDGSLVAMILKEAEISDQEWRNL